MHHAQQVQHVELCFGADMTQNEPVPKEPCPISLVITVSYNKVVHQIPQVAAAKAALIGLAGSIAVVDGGTDGGG
jgi:hypothetical protein